MTVRPLVDTPTDIALFRSTRLRALGTDPAAFGSTYEREVGFDDETWRSRMLTFAGRPGVVLIDEVGGDAVGIGGVGMTESPTIAVVWGMWVAPEGRRSGSARRVLDAAIAWAADRGLDAVDLQVVRTNGAAKSLYESSGFRVIEPETVDPTDPCASELTMRLALV